MFPPDLARYFLVSWFLPNLTGIGDNLNPLKLLVKKVQVDYKRLNNIL